MTISSGLAEDIKIVDSNGNNVTSLVGAFGSANFIIDESSREERGVTTKGKPAVIQDGPVENRASLTTKPETLEILKLMGTFDSSNGTIVFDEKLPEHQVLKGEYVPGKSFKFTDFKNGGFTLESGVDETLTITFDPIQAKNGEIVDSGTASFDPDCNPLQWKDTKVKIDGNQFGTVESIAGSMLDRNISPEYGLGRGREPAEIVEGNFSIQPSFVVKVEDAEPWKKLLDNNSFPLQVQDKRSPVNEISFDFGQGNGELVVTNAKLEINEFEMLEDKETRTIELNIFAENIKVRNL